jgi:uroporphyrinogen decarboxylase
LTVTVNRLWENGLSLKNDRFLRALLREPVDITPVWMMRQAGRYLPEYRATRQQAGDFMTLCQTPELACEVTMQPLRRYAFDAAILFSDILTIPDAFGQGLYFVSGEGPKFRKVIREPRDVEQLPDVDITSELSYVTDAVSLIRRELNGSVPLIGFSGSPWTLATYMIEGSGSKDFRQAKQFMYNHPEAMHALLARLASAVTDYLNAQIRAGAQAVQIFDTWGGILTPNAYREFSLRYMEQIVSGLIKENEGRQVPSILFTKNGGQWLESMADSQCQALGLDWTTDIGDARARVGDKVALQGNMDPSILYASPAAIREEVGRILARFGNGSGHVFNLGHGITPEVNPDHVSAFVDAVHELSGQYHN